MTLDRFEVTQRNVQYFTLLQCGPHWVRSISRSSEEAPASSEPWQIRVPEYEPATVLTAALFIERHRQRWERSRWSPSLCAGAACC